MGVFWFAITNDWPVLLPIVICSIVCLAVTIERFWFYSINRVSSADYIHQLQKELERGPAAAHEVARRQRGVMGDLTAEGLDIVERHPERFDTMFDVATSLAMRELDRNIAVIGTIATISPYLGLFGTVVRILLTFGELAQAEAGGTVSSVMFGIGSALIATAFGLGVAIVAVALNNYFRRRIEQFAGDFELLKLVLMGAANELAVADERPAFGRRAAAEPRGGR